MRDRDIEQLEDDLYASRIAPWPVEKFLAERHRAKFQTLTAEPGNRLARVWTVVKDLTWLACGFVGYVTILTSAGYWLLTGDLPLPPRH